ncbi:glycosyltransferase family 4 protein [Nitrospinae bacterium AH_259_B05_G02_I21]|nr:glycosyltransferase family 4 protein [Nitrospinae bacterium AH_259_B05_G02_I21]
MGTWLVSGLAALIVGVTAPLRRQHVANPRQRTLLRLEPMNLEVVDRYQVEEHIAPNPNPFFLRTLQVAFVPQPGTEQQRTFSDQVSVIQVSQHPPSWLEQIGLSTINGWWAAVRLARRLVDVCRQEHVGLVIAQDPHLLGCLGWFVARLAGVPFGIHVVQNYDASARSVGRVAFPPFRWPMVERLVERFLFGSADLVIGNWEHYKDYALAHGASLEKSFAYRFYPSSLHRVDPGERKNLQATLGLEGRPILLSVGRLHPVKYPGDLLAMMTHVIADYPRAVLLMVGQGELRPQLEREAHARGLEESVRFLGWRSQEELLDLFVTADVIVVAHMGVALSEAALSATPIVAYDHDWHSELLGCDERGLVVPFRDAAAMARAVVRLLEDPEFGKSLGAKARAYALEHYSKEMAQRIEYRICERFFSTLYRSTTV